jgi:hypothetical protein
MLKVGESDKERADFTRQVINQYMLSDMYTAAKTAQEYDRCKNTTIMNYQRMVTMVTGEVVPDRYSAQHRSASNFFHVFVAQLTQFLMGNGVKWEKKQGTEYFGLDFDGKLQKAGKLALIGGVSYGFYKYDSTIEVFSATEFAPIMDERTGRLAAGVRFWRIDETKPLNATLYEPDGCQEFLFTSGDADEPWTLVESGVYTIGKMPYSWIVRGDAKDVAEGTVEIVPGEPVDGLPIVPMYANSYHQSELVPLREKIDAYDFILNGFEDDLDNAQLYWLITGTGGMEDEELQRFVDNLKTVRATAPGEDQSVTPVQVEIPYEARERLLDRIEKQLYKDAMILNPEDISSGAVTATQIMAAYERQNVRTDDFEYCVLDFIYGLMKLAGIDERPGFDRSYVVNRQEEIQTLIAAAPYLGEDYVIEKILNIYGDGDRLEQLLAERDANEIEALSVTDEEEEERPGRNRDGASD